MPTTTSKAFLRGLPASAGTKEPASILHLDKWREVLAERKDFIPLNNAIREYESDPRKLAAMQEARRLLADRLVNVYPNRLKTLRLQRGLSQNNLAMQIGTTQAQIARVESGRRDVQVSTILRIAAALGIAPLEAFGAFLSQQTDDG